MYHGKRHNYKGWEARTKVEEGNEKALTWKAEEDTMIQASHLHHQGLNDGERDSFVLLWITSPRKH